jgi:hypothetical protein
MVMDAMLAMVLVIVGVEITRMRMVVAMRLP